VMETMGRRAGLAPGPGAATGRTEPGPALVSRSRDRMVRGRCPREPAAGSPLPAWRGR
jgi:hypothetical protein